ncbi:MAG: carboxypeptidase regulatory-like domain-containing protein [Melioribacteraceae bacterium]|nr:carboxypeptidase regulatory-like domain-containing protein [Melioribacteraceae bacterium]
MNFYKLLKQLSFIAVMLAFGASSLIAQTYVSNTNGNDVTGTGTALSPYKTIAVGMTNTASGGTIIVDPDTYAEGGAQLVIGDAYTFVAEDFWTTPSGLTVVTITNGIEIAPGAGKTVSIGETGLTWNLGATANALELTDGALNIVTANVTIASGGTVTRTAGTLNQALTTTNVNVTYDGTLDIAAGPEVPADLGTGLLTVNITAGKTVTFANAIETTGGITVTTGNATFNGNLDLSTSTFTNTPAGNAISITGNMSFTSGRILNSNTGVVVIDGNVSWSLGADLVASAVDNNGNGTITLNGTVSFTHDAVAVGDWDAVIDNNGTGTITLAQGFSSNDAAANKTTRVSLTNVSTGNLISNSTITAWDVTQAAAAGAIKVAGGTVKNAISVGAAGTLELTADLTASGAVAHNNAGTIKLNSNTLTISGAGGNLPGGGNVISTTAATVGSGTLSVTNAITVTQAQLPNVSISGAAGKLTLGGATVAYGNVVLNSAVNGALTDGGFNLTLHGNFTRSDNTPTNHALTGTLTFANTTTAQTLTPGASLSLNNLTLNKAAGVVVTLQASIIVKNNLTITAGSLNVGDANLNMTGTGVTFDNSGSAYSSTGNGYVVFENASAGGALTATIQGTGTFGNILINLVDATDHVATGSNISFSGILYINKGDLDVDGAAETLTFTNTLVASPTIKINTTAANSASLVATAGAVAVAAATTINLEYFGTTAFAAALEWSVGTATKLNNVTINTTNVAVTGYNGASTIAGVLTVASGATLTQGANVYTLSGASKTHSVLGTVGGGTLTVTGAGSAINGGVAAADAAKINNLIINLTNATDVFTSSNLKEIADLTVTKGDAAITMTTTVSKVANVTLTAGSLNLNMPGTTAVSNTHTGDLTLTSGTLTYTRTAAQNTIAGKVTLTAGDLILGSNVLVAGDGADGILQDDGNINLGGFDLTLQPAAAFAADYDRTAAGAAGTITNGTLVLDATTQAIDLSPGTSFVLPNVECVGTANGVTFNASLEIGGTLLVDNAGTLTQGAGVLTVSGGSIHIESDAGAFTGAMTITGTTVTLEKDYAIPTLVINSAGTVSVVSDPVATVRTLTVGTAFTLTQGTLAMGDHHLAVSTAFTYTAGSITQEDGILKLNVALPTLPATGFAVDNLQVLTTATSFGTSAVTVNKNLIMDVSITTSADGKLTLGDGCLITRTANAAVLSKLPTFGANTDVKYMTFTGGDISTAKELPATVRNLTLVSSDATANNADAVEVLLTANVTVSGTLSLADKLDAVTNSKTVTMGDGSTLELKVNGTVALDKNVVKSGAMDLVYNGATNTSLREFGTITSGAHPTYTGDITFKNDVNLDAATHTINGTVTLDGGNIITNSDAVNAAAMDAAVTAASPVVITINGHGLTTGTEVYIRGNSEIADGEYAVTAINANTFSVPFDNTAGAGAATDGTVYKTDRTLNLQGNVAETANKGWFRGTGNVNFTGANDQTLTIVENKTIAAYSSFAVNKTNADDYVLLSGGNLDFAANSINLGLTKGVLNTDATSKIILKQSVSGGQPTQGFARTAGVVAGNVEKFIDRSTTVDISKVEFPTGSLAGEYRPANFYFKSTPQSSINLLVNHEEVSPGGENGIPLTVNSTLTVTNYPDFFWFARSDIALAPSYKFDVEFQAQGYNDYVLDGIENVRLMRRDSGNVANNWVLQGGTTATYDNSTIDANWPLVKVIDATGGITQQGSRFTYSQSNKAPVVAKTATKNSAVLDVSAGTATINEKTDTLVVTYTVSDPDIGDAATLSSTLLPTGATWANSKVTWTPGYDQAGTHEIIITGTDTYNQMTHDTLTVTVNNVNQPPTWTAAPTDTTNVYENTASTFTFTAVDADVQDVTYTFAVTAGTSPDSISIVDTTGVLYIMPAFGEAGNVFSVKVTATDGASPIDSTVVFKVNNVNRVPVVDTAMPDTTVAEAATLTLDFGPNFSDPDAEALTFTHKLLKAGVAVDSALAGAMTAAGVFTWTPSYVQAGDYVLVATASDGLGATDDTVAVVVTDVNAAPTFTEVLVNDTVFVGESFEFIYEAVDLDGDALTFSFADENPTGSTITAINDTSAKFSWTPEVQATAIYLIKVKVSDGTAEANTTGELLVKVTTVDLSGKVTYADGALAIANAEVTLNTAKDTTDANGDFGFTGVAAGSYTLTASKTGNSGGISSADALAAALFFVDDSVNALTDMQQLAADVNEDATVNLTDALLILRKSVGFDDATFTADEWLFESESVTVTTSNVTQNFAGIVAGDVNASFTLSMAKQAAPISVNSSEILKIKPQAEFELPVKVSAPAEVSAYNLAFSYPADLMEFVGVSGASNIIYNDEEGLVKIAFADFTGKKPLSVDEDGAIALLKFKATEAFAKSSEASVTLQEGEVVNRFGKDANVALNVATVSVSIPTTFALMQNYPNPFNPSTTISYDLPENGKVTLTIYNTIGQEVATLVNGTVQEAGSYKVNWNASNLASGIYLYRINVEGAKNHVVVKKMMLMK